MSKKSDRERDIISETATPKIAPPNIFPTSIVIKEIGARKRRSKEPIPLSKTITAISIEVVPKKIAIAIKPGIASLISPLIRREKVKRRVMGKRIPIIMLGGFR
jgi:hypothetical protein